MKKKKKGRQTERERENQNKKKVQLPLHTSIKSKRTPICSVGLGEREIETT